MDVDLHTDLLNKAERDKIAQAGEKIGDLAGAIINSNDGGIFNTYKENRYGNLLNDYIKKSGVSGLFLDEKISLEDKRMALTDLVEGFLNERGYKGPMPEIHIGEKSFAVDSSKGYGTEDSKNGKEIIFISQDSLNSPDVLQKLGHELGHLVKYDKDEKTAENIGSKIENIKPEEEKDYNEYLASIKDKYKDMPSLEESKELESKIPDKYKEKIVGVDDVIIIAGLTVVGTAVWEYTQTPEFKESVRQAWLKSQEKLQKVMTYSEFQILMVREIMITQGGVAPENIVIGTGENKETILPLPNSIPDELKPPIHTGGGSQEVTKNDIYEFPETSPIPPLTNTADTEGKGKVEETNIHVGEIPEVNKEIIHVITEKEAREKYKNTLNKTKVEGDYPSYKSGSDILRDQLLKSGVEEPNYQNAAHHVVAEKGTGMPDATRILEKLGIDVNSACNGVFLPTKKASKTDYDTETLHSGPNGADYKKTVNSRINNAYKDAVKKGLSKDKIIEKVVKEIDNIKNDLQTGKLKINSAEL
ncbi:MAG: AHH domain-containing protein [Fusobacterium varium]|uniref:AHH domain-containing protein n=1 Tax=Fusobacterium varium TaxID=856 RepID=UPI0024324466|nr:AHH domain-containing protein [Fusobacterium varium]UYI77765.1 MAG: AHH domain-containing protein [Fusobacterium varium]